MRNRYDTNDDTTDKTFQILNYLHNDKIMMK